MEGHLEPRHKLEGQTEYGNEDLIAMKATSDPDTLYYHEAMREPDAAKFTNAMGQEWEGQVVNGNFQSMLKSEVPPGAKILPCVWQLCPRCKMANHPPMHDSFNC